MKIKCLFLFLFSYFSLFADSFEAITSLPIIVRQAESHISESIVTIEGFGGILDSSIRGESKKKNASTGISQPGEGPTTGVIISQEGYIVTSTYNFINEPKIITVTLKSGRKFNAKLLGRDFTRKICVLKIEPNDANLIVPKFLPSSEVKVGQWAIAVGIGFGGISSSVSLGLISGKKRIFGKAIQTDANISPANYGGALIDIDGRVLGICTPLSPMQRDVNAGSEWYDSGIGFAIPIADIPEIMLRLQNNQNINYGKLGLLTRVDEKDSQTILVDITLPNSAADKAGLKTNDIILAINNQPIKGSLKLKNLIGACVAGENIIISIQRGQEKIQLHATLDEDTPLKKE